MELWSVITMPRVSVFLNKEEYSALQEIKELLVERGIVEAEDSSQVSDYSIVKLAIRMFIDTMQEVVEDAKVKEG